MFVLCFDFTCPMLFKAFTMPFQCFVYVFIVVYAFRCFSRFVYALTSLCRWFSIVLQCLFCCLVFHVFVVLHVFQYFSILLKSFCYVFTMLCFAFFSILFICCLSFSMFPFVYRAFFIALVVCWSFSTILALNL